MRTVEDALQEIVTYVEARFGLRIRDSKPCEKRTRGHSDPMDVDAANSWSSAKEKDLRLHEMVVSSRFERILNETTMHAKATASNHLGKANKSCHGPRVIQRKE